MPKIFTETDGFSGGRKYLRFADSQFEVPARRHQFLRCSSVVDVHPRPHHALDLIPVDSADFGNYFWQTVYHKLHGTKRYSIDANARASKWRITFTLANQELTDVSLVQIEDTH